MIRRQDVFLLSLGVTLAFSARLITNVITRPEFVGWFNHSTYYWVQVQSLLQDGQLAYEDMPLLFALYAALAQVANWLGMPLDEGIVLVSRCVMAVTPAVIPLAIYALARQANVGRKLGWPTWCLVIASGFLPLTYANMPETLQKNMLGLLLLSLVYVAVFRWLRDRRYSQLSAAILLVAAIVLVHLGSALAAFLLLVAIMLELLLKSPSRGTVIRLIASAAVVTALFLVGIALVYPGSSERVLVLVNAFIPDSIGNGVAIILGLLVWTVALRFVWKWITRKSANQDHLVVSLIRITVLWAGLLALPLWPGEIGMRLLLFMPLALVVVLILLLSQIVDNRWLALVSAGTALVFCAMSIGEAVSMYFVYPNKHQIAAELDEVRSKYDLGKRDFVITPYGVNPTANWFLQTKASLLTAVDQDAFDNYDRVFVLNTLERPAPTLEAGDCKSVISENDRYWTTRHDSPVQDLVSDPDFETFDFFELESLPDDWSFDEDGVWNGWGECGDM